MKAWELGDLDEVVDGEGAGGWGGIWRDGGRALEAGQTGFLLTWPVTSAFSNFSHKLCK